MRPGKEERTASLIVSRNVIGQKIKKEHYKRKSTILVFLEVWGVVQF